MEISIYTGGQAGVWGPFNHGDTMLPSKSSVCWNITQLLDFSKRRHSPSKFWLKTRIQDKPFLEY
jgi:hypothetical protein